MKQVLAVLLGSVVVGVALCGNVSAGPVWVCAITEAIACEDDGTTGEPDLGGLARPTFLRVDADAKQVTILGPVERRGEISRADTALQLDGMWLLTGVERGRAWSMTISDAGRLTLSMTADGVVWAVFGQAIGEESLALPGGPVPGVQTK